MKKLFFLCAFVFMSMQLQAQMYMVNVVAREDIVAPCEEIAAGVVRVVIITEPTGEQELVCIQRDYIGIGELNVILNDILEQGYKLIHTSFGNEGGTLTSGAYITSNATFILAIP